MNNRTPLYILGALVLIAVIWRIANPPVPVPPGPLGEMPSWHSGSCLGKMGPSAVNPSGTMWAGAWNQTAESGQLRSAVWVIDFKKEEPKVCRLEDGTYASSLAWADDNTISVLAVNNIKPENADKAEIIFVSAGDGKVKSSKKLSMPVARVLAWEKSEMLAELAGENAGQIAILTHDGSIRGKTVSVNSGKNVEFGSVAAFSGDSFVFSKADTSNGNPTYYLGNTATGTIEPLFSAIDLSGRVEDILLSDESNTGVGILVYDGKKFDTLFYDVSTGKVKKSVDSAIRKTWDIHPFSYVTYQGAFTYTYDTGKARKLFDFAKVRKMDRYWINSVQDGRIYKGKDGNYVSVSQAGKLIDIRVINKDGTLRSNLLPSQ